MKIKTNLLITVISVLIVAIIASGCGSKYKKVDNKEKPAPNKVKKQEWLVLDVVNYRNGDPIPQVENSKEWSNLKTGAWCYYNNDAKGKKKYGRLYNWYAVHDSRGLAPVGWHIPTVMEYKTLEMYVYNDGSALKMVGEGKGETAGKNTVGFSAWLSGYRTNLGEFANIGNYAAFWTTEEFNATNANSVFLNRFNNGIAFSNNIKEFGFSIRCTKD